MRTTIRLTVTRPDGVPFDRAFAELTGEFYAWLNKRYAPYVPSIVEEIEEAMYKAKMERAKE